MTITSISVDRLLALLLGIRYRQVVTLKRTYATIMLGWLCCLWDNVLCEPPRSPSARQHSYTTLHGHRNLFLLETFPYFALQPNSATDTRLASTANPSNSTGHGSIQKGSVQCNVDTTNIGCLLSAVCCCAKFNTTEKLCHVTLLDNWSYTRHLTHCCTAGKSNKSGKR